MALSSGARVGSFEVVSPLGAGGMGEVYRARDTKLGREVAIKILPESVAADPDRRARFEREAQLLAALNHPHIAQVHGLEESGDLRALVMELVEGPTLADRIAAGPVPVDEALPLARQIAEALEAAHAQGIVHRDLKPANIKVRSDGTVKVLDFGLAKALDPGVAASRGPLTHSPTITANATAAGIILGTAAYMAPEQARGIVIDARADIWAFGVVLFEMITGRRAFDGDLTSDVLASVLKTEPEWQSLPAGTPAGLARLLRRCLEKDPRRRLQAIGDARIEIEDLISGVAVGASDTSSEQRSLRSSAVPWSIAVLALGLAAVVAWLWAPWRTAAPGSPVRVRAALGADVSLVTANTGASAILSPDGAVLAFVARRNPTEPGQLFVRRLSQLDATPLAGTDGAVNPFFSPDGQWIAFFAGSKLNKVAVTGGAAVTICDAPNSRGGTWTSDGMIVFAENRAGLFRVPAAGGAREPLTPLADGEVTHRHPQTLPGGKALVYTAHTAPDNFDEASIVAVDLSTGTRSVIHRGGHSGRYLASGHVVYMRERTLFALPFDGNRLVPTGSPVPVLEGVTANEGRGEAQFAVSDTGTLAYSPEGSGPQTVPIFWIDRAGQPSPMWTTPVNWSLPRFAPDGTRLAITTYDGKQADVWIADWARDALTRFTLESGFDGDAVWSPDGRRLVFGSTRGGRKFPNLYWQRADGGGEPERLTDSPNIQEPSSWHPSGRFVAFTESPLRASADVMILPIEGSETTGWKAGTPRAFANTPFREEQATFSPDGRWLAYVSWESGAPQVFVRPFPGPGGKWQVSPTGAQEPRWSRARRELLFQNSDGQVMVVPYTADANAFTADRPRPWVPVYFSELVRGFDVHPDGERLAAPPIDQSQGTAKRDHVVLIFNFFDVLARATGKK